MTDIKDLLDRASDVPVTVDVASDLARGRTAVRRRRNLLGAAVAGAAVVVAGAAVGVAAVTGDDGRPTTAPYAATDVPTSTPPTPPPTPPSDPTSEPAGVIHHRVPGKPIDPATLQRTPFFDVPPAPEGWYLVGGQEPYAMYARDGSDADLTGGFKGRLMVLLMSDPTGPDDVLPFDFDGREFFRTRDNGGQQIWVQQDDGGWLVAQYPNSAGFEVNDMVRFLAAVKVLPGAMGAS